MKFALLNDDKIEATKGAKGFCPSCGSELIAKCGEIKVHHWAHKGNRNCDPWWETETNWHRSWKNKFPSEWQEVVHHADNGEKHIADVETQEKWILEFQHSYLKPQERLARNTFYSKLAWVVDGTRRKTDKQQFQRAIEESTVLWKEPLILHVHFPDECRLLKEWSDKKSLVFFDFEEENKAMLWFLFPKESTTDTFLSVFSRESFVELHNKNIFGEVVRDKVIPIHEELVQGMKNIRNCY